MKRLIKALLAIVAAVVLLIVLAAVLVPMLYDAEDLKRTIETRVSKQTGRELRIAGDLEFSVFPWLAVEVNELSLANAPGFGDQPMARIRQARVGVALLPLLRRELVVDEITLTGLDLDLEVNANGRRNWGGLVPQGETQEPSDSGDGPFGGGRIAGLNVRDASVELVDRQTGAHYILSGFDLTTGTLGEEGPVPVELSMSLEDRQAGLRLDVALAARITANLADELYTFDDLELELVLPDMNRAIVVTAPSARANLAAQTLAMERFEMDVAGLNATGGLQARDILGELSLSGRIETGDFSPRALLESLGTAPPATTDPDVLTRARLETSFGANANSIRLDGLAMTLDDSRLTGDFALTDIERNRLRFDLAVDAIDLDRYAAPADEGAAGGEGGVALPGEELRGLDVEGTLRVADLRLAGLDLTDAVMGVTVKGGRLRLDPLTASLYGGTYRGNIALDASGDVPVLSLDETVESIAFSELVSQFAGSNRITGTANANLKATGHGATVGEVLSSLTGNLGLRLDEGTYEGVNVWYEIRKGLALFKGQPAPGQEPDRTVFSRLQFNAAIDGGVLKTDQLLGELPFLALRGDGTIDLTSQRVNLGLVAAVRNVPELSQDPLTADLKGKSFPFRVSGSLTDPGISVDWKQMLKAEATDRLLNELIGDDKKKTGAEDKEKSDSDKRKDAARSLLRGLLKNDDEEEDDDGGGD